MVFPISESVSENVNFLVRLIFILEGTSKNVVSVAESLVTLAFFPVLILIALWADKRTQRKVPSCLHKRLQP